MGKCGCRPVIMQAADAEVAARWLQMTAIPALRRRPGTILGGDYTETIARLDRLAVTLRAAAKRRRTVKEFSAQIEVEDAAAFTQAVVLCSPAWPLQYHPAINRLAVAMKNGGQRKPRGRKRLGKDQIVQRVSGAMAIDERHRLRLAARAKKDAVHQAWWAEVQARGETILTATVPLPKI